MTSFEHRVLEEFPAITLCSLDEPAGTMNSAPPGDFIEFYRFFNENDETTFVGHDGCQEHFIAGRSSSVTGNGVCYTCNSHKFENGSAKPGWELKNDARVSFRVRYKFNFLTNSAMPDYPLIYIHPRNEFFTSTSAVEISAKYNDYFAFKQNSLKRAPAPYSECEEVTEERNKVCDRSEEHIENFQDGQKLRMSDKEAFWLKNTFLGLSERRFAKFRNFISRYVELPGG